MNDVKIKQKPKEIIKKIDKNIVGVQRVKSHLIEIKNKTNNMNNEEINSGEEYAGTRVQNDIGYITKKSIVNGNKIGKKSFTETKQNYNITKNRINDIKSKIKQKDIKASKNIVNNSNKFIKDSSGKSIKFAKETIKNSKKEIKTAEKIIKDTKELTVVSSQVSKKAIEKTKQTIKSTANAIKKGINITIKGIKALANGTKALIAAIIAGGWVAVVIVLIIVLIAGFIAVIYNNDGELYYDASLIPNSEIVLVAKAQIGNEGGDKFWKWYGFEEHVQWCACFVSWCANECGYIDKGIIPKFAGCVNGIEWFKSKELWHERGENYYPIVGDIIFFDWYDDNGNQDGLSDHVGIVTRTDIDNRTIYTIEGNTSNKCAERMYSLDDVQVMGYGSPIY